MQRSGMKPELGDFCVILVLDVEGWGIPPPRCFEKRVCKALKTKESGLKKRGKRVQEAARDSRERR